LTYLRIATHPQVDTFLLTKLWANSLPTFTACWVLEVFWLITSFVINKLYLIIYILAGVFQGRIPYGCLIIEHGIQAGKERDPRFSQSDH
jgi:hypothetical protein